MNWKVVEDVGVAIQGGELKGRLDGTIYVRLEFPRLC